MVRVPSMPILLRTLLDGPVDFRNHVDHWQRRQGLEVGDAEVTGNGCDHAWIPERSATRLREGDLNVFSKLGNQGLEWRLEPEAFTGGEVRREDDLLDVLVGCPVDIQVARQPST
jgi:hypothetical protein